MNHRTTIYVLNIVLPRFDTLGIEIGSLVEIIFLFIGICIGTALFIEAGIVLRIIPYVRSFPKTYVVRDDQCNMLPCMLILTTPERKFLIHNRLDFELYYSKNRSKYYKDENTDMKDVTTN